MYKYMRDNLKNEYGFLELQDKILEIMAYVDMLCREHNIDYCLMGGSALGAKRHGGFIPWDDDLDIFMTPDNYEKFKRIFDAKGDHSRFYLQELGKRENMITTAKIRMNNTLYIEEVFENLEIHHGIFIDIFILHNCPNNKFQQFYQFFWAKYVITKGLAIRGYERRNGIRGLLIKVVGILPKDFLLTYGLKQVYKYKNKKSDFYCNFLGKAIFKNAIYKKEWFTPTEYINFEKLKLRVPTKIEEFLKERFGDYMKIPSLNEIKWEQHAKKWNCNIAIVYSYNDENKMI